jgi:CBS domain-containing protein
MKVKEIMTSPFEKINYDSSICEASELMRSSDVGILPVEKNGKIVGIVTDRDLIVRAIAQHLDPEDTPVSKVMTSDVTFCYDDEEIEDAEKKLEEKQIHRLLVINSDEKPVGILSLSDLATKAESSLACRALEKICGPIGSRW